MLHKKKPLKKTLQSSVPLLFLLFSCLKFSSSHFFVKLSHSLKQALFIMFSDS